MHNTLVYLLPVASVPTTSCSLSTSPPTATGLHHLNQISLLQMQMQLQMQLEHSETNSTPNSFFPLLPTTSPTSYSPALLPTFVQPQLSIPLATHSTKLQQQQLLLLQQQQQSLSSSIKPNTQGMASATTTDFAISHMPFASAMPLMAQSQLTAALFPTSPRSKMLLQGPQQQQAPSVQVSQQVAPSNITQPPSGDLPKTDYERKVEKYRSKRRVPRKPNRKLSATASKRKRDAHGKFLHFDDGKKVGVVPLAELQKRKRPESSTLVPSSTSTTTFSTSVNNNSSLPALGSSPPSSNFPYLTSSSSVASAASSLMMLSSSPPSSSELSSSPPSGLLSSSPPSSSKQMN